MTNTTDTAGRNKPFIKANVLVNINKSKIIISYILHVVCLDCVSFEFRDTEGQVFLPEASGFYLTSITFRRELD